MKLQRVGKRLEQLRKARVMSQRDLARYLDVSHVMVSKYERDLASPREGSLKQIADFFDVPVNLLYRPPTIKLDNVRYRATKEISYSMAHQHFLKAEISRRLETLAKNIGTDFWAHYHKFNLPRGLPREIETMEEIESFADKVRSSWNLGIQPIASVIDTLELSGVKVLGMPSFDPGFDGLWTCVDKQLNVIVISLDRPGDRIRFTLAHELGHILLEGRTGPRLNLEDACYRFAGAFLVPKAAVIENLGERRRLIPTSELIMLKHRFGASIQVWLHRAHQCGVVSPTRYQEMRSGLEMRNMTDIEPGLPYPVQRGEYFLRRILRLGYEGAISSPSMKEILEAEGFDEITTQYELSGVGTSS